MAARKMKALKAAPEREADIQRAILQELSKRGFWAWRVNSGAVGAGAGSARRLFRGAPPGTPDIRVEVPSGYLEVKRRGGTLTEYQRSWHARAQEHGVRVATVHSVDEALEVVNGWR